MTYLYQCQICNMKQEINKPMAESDRVEHCSICEGEMKRVYEAPSICTMDGVKS